MKAASGTTSAFGVLVLAALLLAPAQDAPPQSAPPDEAETGAAASAQQAPPNLLFILTDEQRYDTSAPYGNDRIRTPTINRLGRESVVFERAYVTQAGWKLIWVESPNTPTDYSMLFDLNEDPNELNNLYDAPAQQDRVRRLKARLRDWQARTHDTQPIE
jgi:arylsulfatase A-like enzyme